MQTESFFSITINVMLNEFGHNNIRSLVSDVQTNCIKTNRIQTHSIARHAACLLQCGSNEFLAK